MFGEVSENNPRLAQFSRAVCEHRHFAHFIDFGAIFRCARFAALEKIDIDGLPIGADQIEHKRGAVRVPGLSEAVELIFRHEFSLRLKDAKTFESLREAMAEQAWRTRRRLPAPGSGRRRMKARPKPRFCGRE